MWMFGLPISLANRRSLILCDRDPRTERLVRTDQAIHYGPRTGRGPVKFLKKRTGADHMPIQIRERGPG